MTVLAAVLATAKHYVSSSVEHCSFEESCGAHHRAQRLPACLADGFARNRRDPPSQWASQVQGALCQVDGLSLDLTLEVGLWDRVLRLQRKFCW